MAWHAMTAVLAAATPAATATIAIDGANVANWLRTLAGTLFLAVIAIRGLVAVIKARLLEIATLFALGALCALITYDPEIFQGLGAALRNVLTSGG